jgi:hypothetical protein
MSFNLITEGSKDYMKYVLQLSEAKSKSKSKIKIPMRPESMDVPENSIREPGSKPTQGGGRGIGGDETPVYKREKTAGDSLDSQILFGQHSSYKNLHKRTDPTTGETYSDAAGGLDYITDLAQTSSFIDAIDQNMPTIARLGIGWSKILNKEKLSMSPGGSGSGYTGGLDVSTGSMGSKGGPTDLGQITAALDARIPDSKANKFANKVLTFSKNLGALDPFNPLLGYKIGNEMLGGREILKRTRELGAAQSSGAQSSMGHPSGFGYFGR